jgi:hypothetical protein
MDLESLSAAPPRDLTVPVRAAEMGALVALCILAEIALWGGAAGAGEACLFVAAPAIVALGARERIASKRLAAIAVLLAVVAARSVWQSSFGTVLAGSALLVAFAVALRSDRPYVAELVVSAVCSIAAAFGRSITFAKGGAELAAPARLAGFRWVTVLVPAVVLALFGLVFVAANPLVERWAALVSAAIFDAAWLPSPAHAIFWFACAIGSVALLRPVCRRLGWTDRLGPGHELADDGLPPTSTAIATSRNVLVGVNALFFAYNAVDAVYLWAGAPPPGIGFKTYAHRGALWLTVALALSTLVLGVVFRGSISFDARARPLRLLGYAWAAQNFALAAGTFRRIGIYVTDSGLTRLRIVGIYGSALVAIGLALIVVKLARRKTATWLIRGQLDAFAIAVVLFLVTPVHAIATRFNVARIGEGQYRPLVHFFAQSTSPEGIVAVVPLLDHPDPVIRDGAAGLLADWADRVEADEQHVTRWAEWEGSRRAASRVFAAARPKIDRLVPTPQARAVAIEALYLRAYPGAERL